MNDMAFKHLMVLDELDSIGSLLAKLNMSPECLNRWVDHE